MFHSNCEEGENIENVFLLSLDTILSDEGAILALLLV